MNKAVLIAAALLVAPLTSSGQEVGGGKERDMPSMQSSPTQKGAEGTASAEQAGSQAKNPFREQVAEAIETVEHACSADIEDYCGRVPSGEGRLALCMLSHEDLL